ncbi:MAG: T9SS type A sorting domain-containing protein [Flavobacteriales bacterium]|nr:T9SS type A sorting domain-containing protein [Flavobacteriales bacterium]
MTVLGFAYKTCPGEPINAGQIEGGCMPTGIGEVSVDNNIDFMLYPNPVKDNLHVILEPDFNKGRVSVIDIQGDLEASQSIVNNNSSSISLSHFPAGNYTVIVETLDRKSGKKIVKTRPALFKFPKSSGEKLFRDRRCILVSFR